ncbi:MAG: hypothetical protein ACLQDY_28065 [Streptosporangiaceae bacterium]
MKYNGTKWTAVPSTPAGLDSVSCVSATYCVAVGETGGHKSSAYKYNGSAWSWMTPYNTGSAVNQLLSVKCASASSCQAVGDHSGSSFEYPLAEVWNGSKWSELGSSDEGIVTGDQDEDGGEWEAVHCASASSCTAAGWWFGFPGPSYTLVNAWNGTMWAQQASASPDVNVANGTGADSLNGLACLTATCLASGTGNPNGEIGTGWNTLIEKN